MVTFLAAIPAALKLVPRWCWYLLAIALVWRLVLGWHESQVKAHDAAINAAWQAVLDQTVSNYRAAAEAARQADAANKARVEAEQAAINERSAHDYQARIADARAVADRLRRPRASRNNARGANPMTDEQIKQMAERFLSWPLPVEEMHPDGGISIKRPNYAPNVQWHPTGTNLLDYTQAVAMVRHMVEGIG